MTDRASPGRPPIPLDRILTTALQIADEEGADALTLRRLARELNSGTATIYRHFTGRDDLINQVVDRMLGEMDDSASDLEDSSWQEACRIIAHRMFAVLGRHRGAAMLLLKSIPNGPNAMLQRELGFAAMLNGGLPPPLAARTYATLARYVLGFAIQLAYQDKQNENENNKKIVSAFLKLDRAKFPAIVAVANELPILLEEEFSFGLELMISGIEVLRMGNAKKASKSIKKPRKHT